MKNKELFKRNGFNIYAKSKMGNITTLYLYDKEDFLDEKTSMLCVVSSFSVFSLGDEKQEPKLLSWKEIKNTEELIDEVKEFLKIWLNGNVYPDTEEGQKRKAFQEKVTPPLEYLKQYNLFGSTGKNAYSYLRIKEMRDKNLNKQMKMKETADRGRPLTKEDFAEGFNFKCYKNKNVYYCKCVDVQVSRSGNGDMSLKVKSFFRLYDIFNKKEIGKAELKAMGMTDWFVRLVGMWNNGKKNPCDKRDDVINWHGPVVDNIVALKRKKELIEQGVNKLSEEMFERDYSCYRNENKMSDKMMNADQIGMESEAEPENNKANTEEEQINTLAKYIRNGKKFFDLHRFGECDSLCMFYDDRGDQSVCQSKLLARYLLLKGVKIKEESV